MAHTGPPADAVVFVLLDAFRPDYLTRTRFLQQLAAESLTGTLEEPFGFCPRGAYFGGLSMAEQGYTNVFRYDPSRSIFAWTRELAGTGHDAVIGDQLRSRIMAQARADATPFAAAYLDPLSIPLAWLGSFDVCEREAPWSRRCGYRSLFHVLEDSGRKWMEISWPYAGWTGAIANARIAGAALSHLQPHHAFSFIHLPDLDCTGHAYGPGSREIQTVLDETDRLCELIVARALELYRDPVILFAGDHGMLPVVRTVDVASPLAGTGLRWGHDFAFFIDSTMVRCWWFTEHARSTARAALNAAGGGHFVTADESDRWGLSGIDPRNAHDIFLADPGVLFSPNFFDWTGRTPARGMHGYAPDVADNRALFLAHWPRRRQAADAGNVEARRLFPSFLEWLGSDPARFTTVPPVAATGASNARSHWSIARDAAADTVVQHHLSHIARTVRERAPASEAIIITGGFGRGEGTIVADATGARPANDYDVVVVGPDSAALTGLGDSLAHDLQIDFVDLCACPALAPSDPLSQWDHDLKYGSRMIWGNPLVLDRLPRYAPAQIAIEEGVFQLGNRSGGLLLGLSGSGTATDSPEQFLMRQATKFLIAIADCWLIAHADYHASYVIRQRRFRDLGIGCWTSSTADAIDAAFCAKLRGTAFPVTRACDLAGLACSALHELEASLGWTASDGALEGALASAAKRRVHVGPEWLHHARGHGLEAIDAEAVDLQACILAVYRACVAAVRVWPESRAAVDARIAAALAPELRLAPECDVDRLHAAVARSWLSLFH